MINIRLLSIIEEVSGKVLADIGCDHGIVSIEALKRGKVDHVIACDISNKSLQKAKELAKKEKVENISFRCGDGLSVINEGEVDCVVIAGMGGQEVIKILKDKKESINKYVLLAHTNVKELRKFLVNNGLKICKDKVIRFEKHYYNLIVAKKGEDRLTDKELLLGRDDLSNEFYGEYLLYLKDKYSKIIEGVTSLDKKEELLNLLNIVNGELHEG